MVIEKNDNIYYVLSKFNNTENYYYFTIDKFLNFRCFILKKDVTDLEKSNFLNLNNIEVNIESEFDYLDQNTCFVAWRIKKSENDTLIREKIISDFKKIRENLKIDYYKFKIQHKEFELWKNNIHKVNDNQYYFNNDDYGIFVDVVDDKITEFEFNSKY